MGNDKATLSVHPAEIRDGEPLAVRGSGWGACTLSFTVDGKPLPPRAIVLGYPMPGGLRPGPNGDFLVYLNPLGLGDGKHELMAISSHPGVTVGAGFRVRPALPEADADERPQGDEGPDILVNRRRWMERFLGPEGWVPSAIADVQIREVRALRNKRDLQKPGDPQPGNVSVLSRIVPGECNWTPVGAGPAWTGPNQTVAGRTTGIAIDRSRPGTIYIAASDGGVWKTVDDGAHWLPLTDYQGCLRIASLAMDPHDPQHLIAGTGSDGYWGIGLLVTTNGGADWTEVATATFNQSVAYRVVFDPGDPTSLHQLVACSRGIYETIDGVNYLPLRAGFGRDVVLVPTPGALTAIASFDGEGLLSAVKTTLGWSPWTPIASPAFPTSFDHSYLGQCAGQPLSILCVMAEVGGSNGIQGIFRSDDGGAGWRRLDVRIDTRVTAYGYAAPDGHLHGLDIPTPDLLVSPAIARVYTTDSAGTPAHTHTLSLSAEQMRAVAGGSTVRATTSVTDGHSHDFLLYQLSQGNSNTYLAVHPTNPDILYLGNLSIYKNATGGGVFTEVGRSIHVDQHSFAFDPDHPDTVVWAGNDGGVYRSGDGGATWASRNNGLATLMYYSVSSHPRWDAVLLAGAQDTGAHRATGCAAWQQVYGWDILYTAIDRVNPRRMYIEIEANNVLVKSEQGGEPLTWANTAFIPGGSASFGNPFALDAVNPDICYFGNTQLWRSEHDGDAPWTALTGASGGRINAVLPDPADSNTVYIAAGERVYRLQRAGAGMPWTPTDLDTPRFGPTAVAASSLAVDATGTLWATVASNFLDSHGMVANDHVYRRAATDAAWVARANGLPRSVSMNCIVVDPSSPGRVFCGGAIGVYRSDDDGLNWTPWDEGIPNAAVLALDIGPMGLLRAATYGRSVWERPISPIAPCQSVDLYVRDNLLDTGRAIPSPDDVEHPFDPTQRVHHWQSADIKVDAEEVLAMGVIGDYQTPAPVGDDFVAFESALVHRNPLLGRTARVYVQVHNRGPSVAHNVQVRVFFADAHARLPDLPGDLWTPPLPWSGAPMTSDYTPVADMQSFTELPPGQPGVKCFIWPVPPTANEHSCLLALVSCDEDLLDGGGIVSCDELVVQRKQVALHNLHVVDPTRPMMLMLGASSTDGDEGHSDLVLSWGNLPQGARVHLAFEALDKGKPAVEADADTLKKGGVRLFDGRSGSPGRLPEKWPGRCEPIAIDLSRVYELVRGEHSETVIPSVRWPGARSLALVFTLDAPKARGRFDLLQRIGKRVVGGSTYLVRKGRG